jgi:hypothetical protein
MLALLLWVARFWVNRKHRIQWTPICWVAVAWVIYVILRYHSAEVEYTARQELIQIVVYTVMFFIVLNNLHRQHSTRLWVDVLLLVATLVSIYAIYQFITGSDKVWGFVRPAQYKGRGSGTYICPNNLAGFLEMLIPMQPGDDGWNCCVDLTRRVDCILPGLARLFRRSDSVSGLPEACLDNPAGDPGRRLRLS